MSLFRLSKRLDFPPAFLAESDGLLCMGGDLSPDRLILAYKNGIFPWFSKAEPILWWSPDPRMVLFPKKIKISRGLLKKIKKKTVEIRINTAFRRTIFSCAQPRKNKDEETWLGEEMIEAYITLHEMGYAHSIETWKNDALVGGLYGVSIGGSFFGESMFSFDTDASKIALVALSRYLDKHEFDLIDCQVTTDHLLTMGATEISRNSFLNILEKSIKRNDITDIWKSDIKPKILQR